MSDNVLKKDFNKKDVERLRNLVKGKAGERTTQGIGYTKKEEFHKEGDIWEADGRKWTIKDGIKQNSSTYYQKLSHQSPHLYRHLKQL